jgi:hypothetical protein
MIWLLMMTLSHTTSSSSPWKVAVVIPRSPTLPSSKAVRMVWMVAVELLLVQERLLGEQGSHLPRPPVISIALNLTGCRY